MNKTLQYLLICSIFLFCSNRITAQWVQTNGPIGGNPNAFTIVPDSLSILTGTPHGLYRSTDAGNNWSFILGSPKDIRSFASIDTTLFASGLNSLSDDVIYFSTDNGDNWTNINTHVTSINAIVAKDSNLFLAAMGVYRSTDLGVSWTAASSGLPVGKLIISLYNYNGILFAGTLESGNIYYSADNGNTWNFNTIPNSGIYAFTSSDQSLFVSTIDRLYSSTDNGISWTYMNLLPGNYGKPSMICVGSSIFWASDLGVYRSSDNGITWNEINYGVSDLFITSLFNYGDTLLAGSILGGMFRSTNNGETWSSCKFVNSNIKMLAVVGDHIYTGNDDGIFVSNDEGESWVNINWGLPAKKVIDMTVLDMSIFVLVEDGPNIKLVRSVNYGSWTTLNTPSYPKQIEIFGNDIILGTSFGIFRSTDNGDSWSLLGTNAWSVRNLYVCWNVIFTKFLDDESLFRSTNSGISWNNVYNLNYNEFFKLAVIGGNLLLSSNYGLFCSTNFGTDWTYMNTQNSTDLLPYTYLRHNVFATNGNAFIKTIDYGVSWETIDSAVVSTGIASFAVLGDNLYAGSFGAGVWKRPLLGITSVNDLTDAGVPDKFMLDQNYPNPFNPSTTIKFSIPKTAFVKLTIYNAMGQEVSTLISQQVNAGVHSTEWNASGFASGVYFYRITTDNFTETKKLLLLK